MKTIELEDYDLELILDWAETAEETLQKDLDESWESEEGYSYFAESKLRDTKELKQKLEKIYENDRPYC